MKFNWRDKEGNEWLITTVATCEPLLGGDLEVEVTDWLCEGEERDLTDEQFNEVMEAALERARRLL